MAEEIVPQKNCRQCGELKPLSDYLREKHTLDGHRSECKKCHAANVKAHRQARPERHILTLMIQRCHNPKHPKFHCWGGRGIEVCGEWRGPGGFDRFFAHVGSRPSDKHSIDRYPNKDGNYEPGNVRWATQIEQMQNTRITIMLTAFNKTLSLRQWSEELGIKKRTLEWRYSEGWTAEQILGTPLFGRQADK